MKACKSMQTPNSQANNRLEKVLIVCLLLSAFWLRVHAIDASSLWSDEGNTWALLSRSFSQIAVDAAADIHPPGYYWLLKGWATFSGDSAAAMRLFSAFSGTLLVLAVFCIGRRIDSSFLNNSPLSIYALLAALITAVNPLQIFYSQEARMYMPLALAGTLLVYGFIQILRVEQSQHKNSRRALFAAYTLYTISGLCGLWLHYSFPICLAAVGIPFLTHILFDKASTLSQKRGFFTRFLVANSVIGFGYLPWLRIGIDRVLNWPKGADSTSALAGVEMILQTFVVGPLRDRVGAPLDIHWAWLLCGGLLPLLGLLLLYQVENYQVGRKRRQPPFMTVLLASWLFLPLLVMVAFGLFSEAFLKFMLVAAPAWALTLAAFPLVGRVGPQRFQPWGTHITSACMAGAILALSWTTLPLYYTNPLARDNYAGIARYIDASMADDSTRSLVVLNAPGQQEVWRYYESGLPTLALPTQRPINEQETINLLAEKVPAFTQVFALFWATDQADPNNVVERWLDQHAFKGLDSWQGNVRFVRYDLPNNLRCVAPNVDTESSERLRPILFGTEIELTHFCQQNNAQNNATAETNLVRSGDPLLIRLRWQTRSSLAARYKTTLQLLDARNQVVAQRDSEPGGGSLPTDAWEPNTQVTDNYGLVVPPGTPPGSYRLILALYDAENGQRLLTGANDHLLLNTVEVVRPDQAIPLSVVPVAYRIGQQIGPLTLVGYDLYPKGYAHEPNRSVSVGELVHVTLYWQAPAPLPTAWPADLQFTMTLGDQSISAPLVSADYATVLWEGGEFVRGEFDILSDGSGNQIVVEVEGESIKFHPLP